MDRRNFKLRPRHLAYGALLLAVFSSLSGCYFTRTPRNPIRLLEFRQSEDANRRMDCLVIFMPGFLDTPDTFEQRGMFDLIDELAPRCDAIAVDAHFRYYMTRTLDDRMRIDVIERAQMLGYRDLHLVGISMGGLGALLTAKNHETAIRSVTLLAPFLGRQDTLERIREVGLDAWEPPAVEDPASPEGYTIELWQWLRRITTQGHSPAIYLGYGTEDALAEPDQMLAERLDPSHVRTQAGGHKWYVWHPLFRQILIEEQPFR